MKKYHKEHEVCPKCGHKQHSTTLIGYPLFSDKREEYKDLNSCVCSNCGDKHTAHERISIKEFKAK
jgi:transcription elongation factor Elf1